MECDRQYGRAMCALLTSQLQNSQTKRYACNAIHPSPVAPAKFLFRTALPSAPEIIEEQLLRAARFSNPISAIGIELRLPLVFQFSTRTWLNLEAGITKLSVFTRLVQRLARRDISAAPPRFSSCIKSDSSPAFVQRSVAPLQSAKLCAAL